MSMPLGAKMASRPAQLRKSAFAPGFAAPRRAIRRPIAARSTLQVQAFKENAQLQDWRVKQMVEASSLPFDDDAFRGPNSPFPPLPQAVHKYFVDFLSKGNADLADELFGKPPLPPPPPPPHPTQLVILLTILLDQLT
jgi:hypothetical protein